jgi:hypothetical protein
MKTLTLEYPDKLDEQVKTLVNSGWAQSAEQLALDALKRYLETHRLEVLERQLRSDIKWGISGND